MKSWELVSEKQGTSEGKAGNWCVKGGELVSEKHGTSEGKAGNW